MTQKRRPNKRAREKPKYYLTTVQCGTLIASTIIGVGVLTLPRATTEAAGHFGWISVLISLLISLGAIYITFKLCERFPEKSLVDMCEILFGSKRKKWVGRVVGFPFLLAYVAFWTLTTAIVVRTFGEVVVTAVLTNTPLEVIVATMLLLCFVLSLYDEEVVARVNEVLLLIIVLPVLFISVSAYQNASLENIMPLWSTGSWFAILMGSLPALTSFFGFEVILMFNGNIKQEKKLMRHLTYGILTPGLVYFLIVMAGIMSFGYEELAYLAWPTLELIKSITVPGLILERLEAVFLGVWVAAVFTTAGTWYFCAVWSCRKLFRIKNKHWTSTAFLVGIYFVAINTANNVQELFQILAYVGYAGLVFSFGMPLLFLLVAMSRQIDLRQTETTKENERVHEAS